MGKKKSAALIALVTVVLVGLLFLCITPTFPVKSPNSFRSLLSIVELGRDLDGGYYTVYYPEGVISKAEYETLKASYDYDSESTENPDDNYVAYKGIYLSKDIAEEGGVTQEFQDQFGAALRAVNKRYEKAGMSDYTLRVQDDYTIRIEIPGLDFDDYYAEQYAQSMITYFSYSGGIVLSDASAADGEATAQMEGSGENIRSVTTANAGDSGYAVVINLTSAGREAFREMTSTTSSSSSSSSSSPSSSSATVYVHVGDQTLLSAGVKGEMDQDTLYIGGFTEEEATVRAVLLDSCISDSDIIDLSFETPECYSMDPVAGTNSALIVAICIGVLVLAMLVFSLVKFKGMGLAHVYGFVTYAVAVIACISLIPAVQITLGGVIGILLASAIMVSCNYFAFNNIKKEFATGKTLTASIKTGYKKSLAFTIDVHAILILAGLAVWLISTGAAKFMALPFLLAVAISALCTLLVTRFYLYMFMAQPKNKIAFVGFKREETEDE